MGFVAASISDFPSLFSVFHLCFIRGYLSSFEGYLSSLEGYLSSFEFSLALRLSWSWFSVVFR
jgi:hypothetical protein